MVTHERKRRRPHSKSVSGSRFSAASTAIAALAAENREPLTLFECGRRLLRSWVTINAAAYSYHPISVVINQPTVTELAQMAGVSEPVAVFRVGYTFESTARSNRRGPDGLTR